MLYSCTDMATVGDKGLRDTEEKGKLLEGKALTEREREEGKEQSEEGKEQSDIFLVQQAAVSHVTTLSALLTINIVVLHNESDAKHDRECKHEADMQLTTK